MPTSPLFRFPSPMTILSGLRACRGLLIARDGNPEHLAHYAIESGVSFGCIPTVARFKLVNIEAYLE